MHSLSDCAESSPDDSGLSSFDKSLQQVCEIQVFEYGVDEWLALCKNFHRLSERYPDSWEPSEDDTSESTEVCSPCSPACVGTHKTTAEAPHRYLIEKPACLPFWAANANVHVLKCKVRLSSASTSVLADVCSFQCSVGALFRSKSGGLAGPHNVCRRGDRGV